MVMFLIYSLLTILWQSVTHTLAPSRATAAEHVPTAKAPSSAPSLARSLVTVLRPATQMLAPSKTSPLGLGTVKVPSTVPSLARSFVTVPSRLFATQMLVPSKATPVGPLPTLKVPNTAPSLARSLVTVWPAGVVPVSVTQILVPSETTPLRKLEAEPTGKVPNTVPSVTRSFLTLVEPRLSATHILVPSKAIPAGPPDPGESRTKVPNTAPSVTRSLVTLPPLVFVTQMLTSSKATPVGWAPTANVPNRAPSLARSLVTLLEPGSTTQTLSPSKVTPNGLRPRAVPTGKLVVRLAGYQCRVATCCGFFVELVTPPWASAEPHIQARARETRMLERIAFDIKMQSPLQMSGSSTG